MTGIPTPRPWYVHDRLCDDWLAVKQQGGDLKMLKSLKIARSIVVNLGIISISLVALYYGARPDILGPLGVLVLAGYNGVEVMDYLSLLQAIAEAKQQQDSNE